MFAQPWSHVDCTVAGELNVSLTHFGRTAQKALVAEPRNGSRGRAVPKVCVSLYTYIHTYKNVCVCARACVCVFVCIYVGGEGMEEQELVHGYVGICTHTHTHLWHHTYTYTRARAYTHTHTPLWHQTHTHTHVGS